jgi:hypothetical protein
MQHHENAVRLGRLGSRIAGSSTQALGEWRGGSRFEWSTVALERASRSFHGRPNSFAFQSDRNSILAVCRDGVGDEVGGGRGRVVWGRCWSMMALRWRGEMSPVT